jgi:hypothetical protein
MRLAVLPLSPLGGERVGEGRVTELCVADTVVMTA